jgi:hypothetical protein
VARINTGPVNTLFVDPCGEEARLGVWVHPYLEVPAARLYTASQGLVFAGRKGEEWVSAFM